MFSELSCNVGDVAVSPLIRMQSMYFSTIHTETIKTIFWYLLRTPEVRKGKKGARKMSSLYFIQGGRSYPRPCFEVRAYQSDSINFFFCHPKRVPTAIGNISFHIFRFRLDSHISSYDRNQTLYTPQRSSTIKFKLHTASNLMQR